MKSKYFCYIPALQKHRLTAEHMEHAISAVSCRLPAAEKSTSDSYHCIFCNKFQYQISKCFTKKASIILPILQMGTGERYHDFCTMTARQKKGVRWREIFLNVQK